MSKENNSGVGCLELVAILFLVAFVVLKLCNVITWSWWWVLSPLWILVAIVLVLVVLLIISKM